MVELIILPPAAKYIKKLKDKKLKKLYQDAIDEIIKDPSIGEDKNGDLAGLKGYDIYYNKTNYELAYRVEYVQDDSSDEPKAVIVIMAGTRENFYAELKRYWK
jgi:mRNA-degrading endonuclease RelE of RelBE toxin-antitoxin system